MSDTKYSWDLVANIAKKKFLEQNKESPSYLHYDGKFDQLKEIYHNMLPSLLKDVMVGAYVRNDYSPEM